MKKRILLTLVLFVAGMVSLMAQTTALVTYEGGYFVKDGEDWTEYRPADKAGKWAAYEQYKEDDTFFYVKNKNCKLAIPKLYKDKIFIKRDKKGEWEVVYNTLSVHLLCPEGDALFYSYRNHALKHGEYDGYFVRDNLNWREYRPRMKSALWAEYKQVAEDGKFFILESTNNIVYIPKTTDNDIMIEEKGNPNWHGGYAIQAVYDRSATFLYNFYYPNSGRVKRNGSFELEAKGARISFDNKCNIQVALAGKHYDLVYTGIEIADYDGKEAVLITIDKKNRIWLMDGTARIESKVIGKKMILVGSGSYAKVLEQLKMGTFKF